MLAADDASFGVPKSIAARWAAGKPEALVGLMTGSLSSFATLFRHALVALGQPEPESKRAAIERMAQFAGASPAPFLTALDIREGKRKESEVDATGTLREYLALVERVADEVDRRFGES